MSNHVICYSVKQMQLITCIDYCINPQKFFFTQTCSPYCAGLLFHVICKTLFLILLLATTEAIYCNGCPNLNASMILLPPSIFCRSDRSPLLVAT